MKIPLNRIVTFALPYVNVAAGAVAAWLIAKANLLGLPGLGSHQHELATGLAAAGAWALTTGTAHLANMKWLKGHHIEMAADAQVQAAALSGGEPQRDPDVEKAAAAAEAEEHELVAADASGDLVSDEEEFTSPPPNETNAPVQPSQAGVGPVAAGDEFPPLR